MSVPNALISIVIASGSGCGWLKRAWTERVWSRTRTLTLLSVSTSKSYRLRYGRSSVWKRGRGRRGQGGKGDGKRDVEGAREREGGRRARVGRVSSGRDQARARASVAWRPAPTRSYGLRRAGGARCCRARCVRAAPRARVRLRASRLRRAARGRARAAAPCRLRGVVRAPPFRRSASPAEEPRERERGERHRARRGRGEGEGRARRGRGEGEGRGREAEDAGLGARGRARCFRSKLRFLTKHKTNDATVES